MTDIEIKLDEKTDWARVQFKVASTHGGLRIPSCWDEILGRSWEMQRANITFTGPLGFSASLTVRRWEDDEEILFRLDREVRPKWEDHLAKMKALEALTKKQHDLRELALDEIAERHLQDRPPYHVTATMPVILAAVRQDLLERMKRLDGEVPQEFHLWLGDDGEASS